MRTAPRLLVLTLGLCCVLVILTHYRASRPPHSAVSSGATARARVPAGRGALPQTGAQTATEPSAESPTVPVPDTVPDVRVPDLTGRSRSLREFVGHPLIINFWATWCEPCRREMPMLQQLQVRYHAAGLQILGVAVDSPGAVQQYLKTRPIDYPLLVGEDQATAAMDRFGAQPALPFSVFADAQGRVIVVKIGELHREEADYILATEAQVERGQETLPDARSAIAIKLRDLAIERARSSGASSS